MQSLVAAWRETGRPPAGLTDGDQGRLFDPLSPLADRLDVLRRIAAAHQPNLFVKMVLVGMSGAGKTSVVAGLRDEPRVGDAGEGGRTVVLDVSVHEVRRSDGPPYKLAAYDFAGHRQYFSMQEQFLGSDNIAVIVQDLSVMWGDVGGALEELHVWVEALRRQAGRGGSTAVVILGTHLDEVCGACVGVGLQEALCEAILCVVGCARYLETMKHVGQLPLICWTSLRWRSANKRHAWRRQSSCS